jgi:signal transduction histidine kinase
MSPAIWVSGNEGLSLKHWLLLFTLSVVVAFLMNVPTHEQVVFDSRVCPGAQNADACDSEWTQGTFVNAGYSDARLELKLDFEELITSDASHFLSVKPAYHDSVRITFFDYRDRPIRIQHKGDQVVPESVSPLDLERLTFEVPGGARTAEIAIRSVGSLRAALEVDTALDLYRNIVVEMVIRLVIAAFIFLSAIVVTILAFVERDKLFAYYGVYQLVWTILLVSMSNVLPAVGALPLGVNHHLVGVSAIMTSVVGILLHRKIMVYLIGEGRSTSIMRVLFFIWLGILVAYVAGWQNEALRLNILGVAVVAFVASLALARTPARDRYTGVLLRRVRFSYVFLLIAMTITGVSGAGYGSQIEVTYVHSLLAMIVLSLLFLERFLLERRVASRAKIRQQRLAEREEVLSERLSEQRVLVSALAHEIKTPLATLFLKVRTLPNGGELRNQLERIEHVVSQVYDAQEASVAPKHLTQLQLADCLEDVLGELSDEVYDLSRIRLGLRGNLEVRLSEFAVCTIIRNLVGNALKYSDPDSLISVRLWRARQGVVLRVRNSVVESKSLTTHKWFEKYWRASDSSNEHGMGLGLWLVKYLVDRHGFGLSAKTRDNQVIMTVLFK